MLKATLDAKCPHCGYKFEETTCVSGKSAPHDGDFSFCIKCGEWSIFDEGGVRVPTIDEYMVIGTSDKTRRVREAWLGTMAGKAKPEPEEKKRPSPLDEGFNKLMAEVYKKPLDDNAMPDIVRKEFRRHFFCGAVTALMYLAEAINDDETVDFAELMRRYDDLVLEERRFRDDLAARKC
ncbi:hypothetical protein GOC14_07205 [Sinorhizobium meliloti]|nr:hypothetical protein [Sinorhizobium meliloti]